jgi:hypothetical protein
MASVRDTEDDEAMRRVERIDIIEVKDALRGAGVIGE